MRGLVKAAALLLAPALVGASSFGLEETVPAAFITLEIPLGKTQAETLTLRLDVQESEQLCGHANVTINSQTLSQDAKGEGQGHLNVDNGAFIEAAWHFECVGDNKNPIGQLMTFAVQSLDGEPVPEASFSASFRQMYPVEISDVAGAAYIYRLSIPIPDETLDIVEEEVHASPENDLFQPPKTTHQKPHHNGDLSRKMNELKVLHAQAHKLHQLIYAKEMALHRQCGSDPSPSFNLRDCDSVQCVVRGLAGKMKHKAGDWCGGMGGIFGKDHRPHPHGGLPFCTPCGGPRGRPPHPPPPPPPFEDFPPPPPPPPHHGGPPGPPHGGPPEDRPHPGDDYDEGLFGGPESQSESKERPMASEHGSEPHSRPPHHGHGPDGHRDSHHDLPIQNLFIGIAIAAAIGFAFCSFAGICCMLGHDECRDPEQRRFLRYIRHLSREQQRARRHNRKVAIKAFFKRIFPCWTNDDEEKQVMLEGRTRDSGKDLTMEQDIAQFRQAAFMVEDMLAAEEGRSQRETPRSASSQREMPQQPSPQPPKVPEPLQYMYPGYNVSSESLPSYSEETVNSSMVSDGCRYAPGSSDYTPSSNGSNADGVLGDLKH